MYPHLDPDRVRIALAALAGAFVFGLFNVVTLFTTGAHVSRLDYFRAFVNVLAAAVAGVVTAVVIAPPIAGMIPWASMRDAPTIGFFFGGLTWTVLPFVIQGAKNRAKKEADKQGGAE